MYLYWADFLVNILKTKLISIYCLLVCLLLFFFFLFSSVVLYTIIGISVITGILISIMILKIIGKLHIFYIT